MSRVGICKYILWKNDMDKPCKNMEKRFALEKWIMEKSWKYIFLI